MPSRLFRETSAVAAALVIALPCAAQQVRQQAYVNDFNNGFWIVRVEPRMGVVPTPAPQATPTATYLVFVASEGNDHIALVRWGPNGATVERDHRIGLNPTELLGPHGIAVSPDGNYYYVTTAHGTPFGALWKYTTDRDSLIGKVQLGAFPATIQVSPDGAYVYAVNFNLYGDPVRSSVSIVYGDQMVEVTRVPTCIMPHGSRLNPQGTKHYSACMMNDELVEIDTRQFAVARHFRLTKGKEEGLTGAPMAGVQMAGQAMSGHDMTRGPEPVASAASAITCSPTWAQPSADGSKVYVACNKSNEIVEIDVASWKMTRRIPAGDGVYNLAATHDGNRLIGTNKRGQSVSVIDIATGKELARIPTTRKVASGITVSSDDRYAFASIEGVGSQPGTVDIIDLTTLQKVASVDVGQQAGGIDFWKRIP
jgi:DNA-binding beta-propeller fold protein YncE